MTATFTNEPGVPNRANEHGDHSEPAWDTKALRDPHRQADKAKRVATMFDAIAPTYERVNRLATLGRDARWRAAAIKAAEIRSTDVVLDVCCGTGDMLRAAARAGPAQLIGVDFSAGMLAEARIDATNVPVRLIEANALALPLEDATVDVVTCAFGVRNFSDLDAGLREMVRVGRPGARVVILEFAQPENIALRQLVRAYTDLVLPWLGKFVARDRSGAYRYLPRSITTFETAPNLARRMEAVGLGHVAYERMNFGGVVLYRGTRPLRQ